MRKTAEFLDAETLRRPSPCIPVNDIARASSCHRSPRDPLLFVSTRRTGGSSFSLPEAASSKHLSVKSAPMTVLSARAAKPASHLDRLTTEHHSRGID